ncbi:MAG: hypothetical protein AB3N18_12885 [Allomuricauda sp.]
MIKVLRLSLLFVALSMYLGCVSENDLDLPKDEPSTADDPPNIDEDPLAALNVAASFDYATSREIQVTLDVPEFLAKAVFSLYGKTGAQDSIILGRAIFDENGHFEKKFQMEAQTDSVLLYSDYIGLTKDIRLAVNGNNVSFDYRPLYERSSTSKTKILRHNKGTANMAGKATYTFLSGFDNLGVPSEMELPDVIQQNMLDDINMSLPEYSRVPVANPEFLANSSETNLVLTDLADVWVTFVSEGAGYRNALGYYSYPVGSKPATVDEITAHNIIFPNTSMVGSGGGLVPGDRVHLGTFPANTVISWFIVANGWMVQP